MNNFAKVEKGMDISMAENERYLIRADGNATIGMGHVMRCMSVAMALRQLNKEVYFVTACEECISVIRKEGFEVFLLSTNYHEMESELPELLRIVKEKNIKLVLVDSYQVTQHYFHELHKHIAVAYLDDLGNSFDADGVINYNIYGPQMRYEQQLQQVLGASYVPLRKEFAGEQGCQQVSPSVRHVLITTGGSDACFAAKGFTDTFLQSKVATEQGIVIHVVSGPFNQFKDELKSLYQGNPRVCIHENVTNMKALMQTCDVILTSAGSTIYEVCALGIPMICFYFVENQKRNAEGIAALTSVVNVGNYAKDAKAVCSKAREVLERCIEHVAYREQLHREEKQIVDGNGAMRIAQALTEMGKRCETR